MLSVDAIVNIGWSRASWGNGPWNDNAFVPIAELTGIQATANIGSVTIDGEINVGWGRGLWGNQVWGLPNEGAVPTGIANVCNSWQRINIESSKYWLG